MTMVLALALAKRSMNFELTEILPLPFILMGAEVFGLKKHNFFK
jgi:hypothetical protein